MSLYDELGGHKALDAVVDSFYKKVLADERVNGFFAETDMAQQARKQKLFLTFAFGGPNKYTGKNMTDGHAHLVARGLNDSHVDAIIELLGATLTEFNVPANKIADVAAVANSVRDAVLGRAIAA
jgi:hemoglobin